MKEIFLMIFFKNNSKFPETQLYIINIKLSSVNFESKDIL